MDRQELKLEIVRMYAKCGSDIMMIYSKEGKDGVKLSRFRHPTCRKTIEVSETEDKILTVLVYNDTTNASQRNCVECKSIEQFKKEIYGNREN